MFFWQVLLCCIQAITKELSVIHHSHHHSVLCSFKIIAKAVKRSRAAEKPYVFKKKGNEARAKFNSEMEDSINDALGQLEG